MVNYTRTRINVRCWQTGWIVLCCGSCLFACGCATNQWWRSYQGLDDITADLPRKPAPRTASKQEPAARPLPSAQLRRSLPDQTKAVVEHKPAQRTTAKPTTYQPRQKVSFSLSDEPDPSETEIAAETMPDLTAAVNTDMERLPPPPESSVVTAPETPATTNEPASSAINTALLLERLLQQNQAAAAATAGGKVAPSTPNAYRASPTEQILEELLAKQAAATANSDPANSQLAANNSQSSQNQLRNGEPKSPSDRVNTQVKQTSASLPVEQEAAPLNAAANAAHTKPTEPKTPSYQSGEWLQARDKLLAQLEAEIRLARQDSARQSEVATLETLLRLQHALAGHREAAAKSIEGLSREEQEFWKHEAFALVDLLAADRLASESRRFAVALQSLEEARTQLSAAGTLTLRNLAFCKKVEDFGNVQKFDRYDFTKNQEVLLYVEARNFAASHSSQGYETELQGSFRVLDRAGAARSERLLPLDKQTCANHRRDYYIAYRIYIPSELAPGAYSLELTLEDKKGNKSNNALLDFNVVP